MADTFKVDISFIDKIKEKINSKRINKQFAQSVGLSVKQFHKELSHIIFTEYAHPKTLESVLVNKSANLQKFGRSSILYGLSYRVTYTDLGKYPYSTYPGNINSWAKREGLVHVTTVRRGNPKIVHGKKHYGGFVQPNGRYGNQMFERKQRATWINRKRAPIRILFGPSLANTLETTLRYNTEIESAFSRLETNLANSFTI